AGLIGAGPSVLLGGLACIAGTALVSWTIPALRRYRSEAPAEEPF
ncbi:MAG: hypothetical protein QOH26_832, partial [Actinomycetota bacterium]|nr:hypothetical protein [Actinomycetota bacterium]